MVKRGLAFLVIGACSSPDLDPTPMPLVAQCPDFGADPYAAMTLAPGVDGIDIQRSGGRGAAIGVPCAGAKDQADCILRVHDAMAQSQGWSYPVAGGWGGPTIMSDRGVATSGDTITPLDLNGFQRAIAPIDSLDEAAAWVTFSGHSIDCDVNNAAIDGTGFRFRFVDDGCSGPQYETMWLVARDGTISFTKRKLNDGQSSCIY